MVLYGYIDTLVWVKFCSSYLFSWVNAVNALAKLFDS